MSATIHLFVILSAILLTPVLIQNSSALSNYDLITELGSFGISKPGYFSHPQSVAVDSEGNVYVTDLGNKRVQKFSSDGQFQTTWGKSGTLEGEFHHPSGIAVDDDHVFVADRDLHRIQKFDHDGNFVSQWGKKGIYEGQFKYPNGIVVSGNFVYVVDTGNQRVQKFTTDGDFVSSFGSSGLGKGELLIALGIDADSSGNLYVTDKGNGNIEKFDPDGNHIESLKYYGANYAFTPEGIAIDSNDELFVINSANDRILHLKQDSFYLSIFDQQGPYPNSFTMPTDLAIGSNGDLLIIDSATHKIQIFKTPFYVQPEIIHVEEIPEPEIKLRDSSKPKIIAPADMEIDATGILTFVDLGEPIATDESGIKTILNNAPDGLPLGTTTIMWIAFDNAGNSSHDFQVITVNACGKYYSQYNRILGTSEDDVIYGTNLDDLIFGLDGNDFIDGGSGDDCIFGGHGDDILYGNEGNDIVYGNEGNDIIKGFAGDDILDGNEGSDVIDGGSNNDHCYVSDDDLKINCE
ncbi:MAG: 6-bladed beta-propeller [Nitrosarchaeum sp.]|nr:6-bladed beta-propeller [Nitrosarchaeum sp.]